jgi:hypothetical protein
MGCSPVHTLGLLKAVINMPTWPSAKKYHDSTQLPLMVLLLFVLQRAENAMKNTIDDADYIINRIVSIIIFQYVTNSGHSHSIVNGHFLPFNIHSLSLTLTPPRYNAAILHANTMGYGRQKKRPCI